jgi:CheY-like chemotaxis protein
MLRVRLFHWKAQEAVPLIAELEAAGFSVDYEEQLSSSSFRRVRESQPHAFVVDLSSRPAHGREVAIALRGHKVTRHVPIIFVNGQPEKVEGVRRMLPDATYATGARLIPTLRRAKPVSKPLIPSQMMDRYAGRTTAQKLGIGKGAQVAVVDPPPDYARAIGDLPEGAFLEEEDFASCKLTLWFVHDYHALQGAMPEIRRTAARHRLWILWRKGKEGPLDGGVIRSCANQVGLVDYKICSVNETWSGIALAVKKPR